MPIPQELILVGWVERSGTQHFQGFVGLLVHVINFD